MPQGRLGLVQLLLPLETQLVPVDPLAMSCCPLESLRQRCKHPSPCRQAVVWEVPAAPSGRISSPSQAAEFTLAACAAWQVGFFLGGPSDVGALLCVCVCVCACVCVVQYCCGCIVDRGRRKGGDKVRPCPHRHVGPCLVQQACAAWEVRSCLVCSRCCVWLGGLRFYSYNSAEVGIASGDGTTSAGAISIVTGVATAGSPGALSLSAGSGSAATVTGGALYLLGGIAPINTGEGCNRFDVVIRGAAALMMID
jgi:hypothetical protein